MTKQEGLHHLLLCETSLFSGNYLAEEDKKEPHKHISLHPLRITTLCYFLHNNPRIAKHINVSPAVPGSPLPWGPPSSLASLDRCSTKLLQRASLCPGQQPRLRHHTHHPSLSRKPPAACPSAFNLSVSTLTASKGAWCPLYWPHLCFVLLLLHLLPILTPLRAPPGHQNPPRLTDTALGYPEDSATLMVWRSESFWEAFVIFRTETSSFHAMSDVAWHSRRVERTGWNTCITPKEEKTTEGKRTPAILSPSTAVKLVCSNKSRLQQNLFYQNQAILCERTNSSENFISMREDRELPLDRLLNAA